MIKIQGLKKVYKTGNLSVTALDDVSFNIKKGEFVAVMGPSGSGKSTLMNILGCLDSATEGLYILDGMRVDGLNENQLADIRNKKIGFVFQAFNLLARTTALKNVELPMMYAGVPIKTRRELAASALGRVGLNDRMHHLPNELSGGQKQRVAIARALVNNPAIILADEPTGNLDTRSGQDIMDIFTQLNRDGVTIVLVTHEHDIARYANRVLSFRDGRLVSDSNAPYTG
jgi:putative ABC transport system ATP-binding protein